MDAAREQQIRQWVKVAKAGDDLLPREWELLRQDLPDLLAALDAARAEAGALRERVETLTAALVEAEDVFELCDPDGGRLTIHAPEDAAVRALCERIGYGAVMDSVARQWRSKSIRDGGGIGAFTTGPCVGTVQSTLKQIRAALVTGETTGV
jgi:hypothetical protein